MSLPLKTIPVGIAYATWSGVGIVLITVTAVMFYGQQPDLPAILGMGISGVAVLDLFSKIGAH